MLPPISVFGCCITLSGICTGGVRAADTKSGLDGGASVLIASGRIWALPDEPFGLGPIRSLHETVAGALMRDTSWRYMEPAPEGTGKMSDGRGRPSRLWVRK